jgi:dihydrofolate reductase
MRKIIVLEHISLDGVIQGPGGPEEDTNGGFSLGGWISGYSEEMLGTALKKMMYSPFDLLIGRKTYDIWAPYWPNNGQFWPNVNTSTKYVASNTLTHTDWQPSVVLNGDVAAKVAALKQTDGPDLHVWGSSELLQTLIAHDLVDSFWLMMYPVTLGKGKRLFGSGAIPAAFKVSEGAITPNGVVLITYERAGEIKAGQE